MLIIQWYNLSRINIVYRALPTKQKHNKYFKFEKAK